MTIEIQDFMENIKWIFLSLTLPLQIQLLDCSPALGKLNESTLLQVRSEDTNLIFSLNVFGGIAIITA